jgi:aldehyde:ferredoxin oxidoreductase
MNGIAALSTALLGMRWNVEKLNEIAERIARTAPLGNLEADLVDAMVTERGFQANAVTATTADEMVGTLLDTVR